jgi:hypothetical protein
VRKWRGDFVGSGSEGVGNVGSGEGLGSEENKGVR